MLISLIGPDCPSRSTMSKLELSSSFDPRAGQMDGCKSSFKDFVTEQKKKNKFMSEKPKPVCVLPSFEE